MCDDILNCFFRSLPELKDFHHPSGDVYNLLRFVIRKEIEKKFYDEKGILQNFPPFGKLIFPYHIMGAVNSLNLFDLDELIIFSFYWVNKNRYKKVADIGANIGLHSILLHNCGYQVRSYEPDIYHFEILLKNLSLNLCNSVETYNSAISNQNEEMEFIRVLGNTMSSHLVGSKRNPYGDLERYRVKVEDILPVINWADLIKIDAEGHEKQILLATNHEHWQSTDALVEVENENNAVALFEHFNSIQVQLYSQKIGWKRVTSIKEMPTSYKEGSLFVSCKEEMPWCSSEISSCK